jgi:tetratricopeptide (TPR) repeat protein
MSARRGWIVLALCAGVAALASSRWALARPAAPPALSEGDIRDRDIAFYGRRAARDPEGAADRAQLAGLYLQRARERGGVADYRRAEAWARRSLARRDSRNGKAQLVLASSLLARHRFDDALAAAESLVAMDSTPLGYRALLGEIQMELGDYAAARRTYAGLASARRHLAVAPRLARWAELTGRPAEARHILEAALADARDRTDLPAEQVAWFHLRVADLHLRHGRLDEAGLFLRDGLALAPDDARLLAARARLEAGRGRWRRAARWGERALAVAPDIATLSLVGDAWAAAGDSTRALEFWGRAEAAGPANPEPFNRQWTLFLLDHARRLEQTRDLLRSEVAERDDVYGWDQLAWALHLTGDRVGADTAIARALRLGTRDAMLFYHAGRIALASGDTGRARRHLEDALRVDPRAYPYGSRVRAVLDSLD